MTCKKSELVTAINSFAAARATNDATLINFSGSLVSELVETIEFEPEGEGESDEDQLN